MKKCLIIANSINKKIKNINWGEIAFLLDNYEVNILFTKYKGHTNKIIKDYQKNYNLIITFGGDGTYSEAINTFYELGQYCEFSHVSTGTANDMASNLDVQNIDVYELISHINNGKKYELANVLINNYMMAYVAMFGAHSDITYANREYMYSSMSFYYKNVLKSLLKKSNKIKTTITLDDASFEEEILFGIIFKGKSFSKATINLSYNIHDTDMNLLLVKGYSPSLLTKIAFDYITKNININNYPSKYIEVAAASKIDILCHDIPDNPHLNIDGDKGPKIDGNINASLAKTRTRIILP